MCLNLIYIKFSPHFPGPPCICIYNFFCEYGFVSLQHGEVDYSAVYVIIKTSSSDNIDGHGLTFTLGRGNNIGKITLN